MIYDYATREIDSRELTLAESVDLLAAHATHVHDDDIYDKVDAATRTQPMSSLALVERSPKK
jgi:hypothetical protein